MAELDAAEYIRSFDNQPEKAREAVFGAFLDNFIKRYEGKTEAVAYAAALKAEQLCKTNLLAAHDLAAEYEAKWSDSPGGKKCANIVAAIEGKKLACKIERNWCAPWPEIEVRAKNLTEVHFRLVPVSFQDLVNDTSMGSAGRGGARDEMKNKYLSRRPVKEWKEVLPLKPDYTEQTFKFTAPSDLKVGHYVLYAAGNEAFGSDKQPLFEIGRAHV